MPPLVRILALAAGLALGLPAPAAPPRPAPAEAVVDHLALAARLLADGHPERAGRVLAEVDEASPDLDRARFLTLRGLARAGEDLHEQAVVDLRAALAHADGDPLVGLHLARSLLALDRAEEASAALEGVGPEADELLGTWLLRASARAAAGDEAGAWVALVQGGARFPESTEVARQRVFLLVRLGLFQQAVDEGRALLARDPVDREGWLAIAEALRRAGSRREAVALLEEARLRFPTSAEVGAQLARLHLEDGRPLAAARLLQVAGELDPELLAAAAEALRQAGDLGAALAMNGRVPDPVTRARQRLGLYVEAQDWGRALALAPRLDRLGLVDEDPVAYALAFASFQLGELDRAEGFLADVEDPRVFRDATALRDAMQRCRDEGGCP